MTNINCCCRFGAAISGEYPEFGCGKCERHQAAMGETEICRRHTRESATMTTEPTIPAAIICSTDWTQDRADELDGGTK